jgi:predicted MFS family arabinose efflux permease
MGLGGMFGGATLGTIADRISIRRTLVATFVILAIAIPMPLFFFTCTMLVYLVILIFGMCYFALFGLIAAYLTKMFPPREASILSGTTFVAVGLGSAIGNFAGGRIIELTGGFSVLYIGIAFLSGTLALVASLTPADRRPLQCARHR